MRDSDVQKILVITLIRKILVLQIDSTTTTEPLMSALF